MIIIKDSMALLRQQSTSMNRSAFTLAEVLITLGIIGVVAAMTIPTLMNSTQNKEFKTALKKSFSIMNQATEMIKMDNGGTLSGLFTGSGNTYSNSMKDAFATQLKAVKTCSDSVTDGCWVSTYHSLDGTPAFTLSTLPGIVVADGASYVFTSAGADSTTCTPTSFCGQIYLDVNGPKKPNVFSKDIYVFNITSDQIVPAGANTDYSTCESSTGAYAGVNCTAKYLME